MKFDIVSNFREALKKRLDAGTLIIDADKMAKEIWKKADLSFLKREDLERRFVAAYVRCLLWQKGFRSIVKGKGYFVHEETLRPELVARLYNNQVITRDQAESVLNRFKKHIRKNSDLEGQLVFDFERNSIVEVITVGDLLKILEKESD